MEHRGKLCQAFVETHAKRDGGRRQQQALVPCLPLVQHGLPLLYRLLPRLRTAQPRIPLGRLRRYGKVLVLAQLPHAVRVPSCAASLDLLSGKFGFLLLKLKKKCRNLEQETTNTLTLFHFPHSMLFLGWQREAPWKREASKPA